MRRRRGIQRLRRQTRERFRCFVSTTLMASIPSLRSFFRVQDYYSRIAVSRNPAASFWVHRDDGHERGTPPIPVSSTGQALPFPPRWGEGGAACWRGAIRESPLRCAALGGVVHPSSCSGRTGVGNHEGCPYGRRRRVFAVQTRPRRRRRRGGRRRPGEPCRQVPGVSSSGSGVAVAGGAGGSGVGVAVTMMGAGVGDGVGVAVGSGVGGGGRRLRGGRGGRSRLGGGRGGGARRRGGGWGGRGRRAGGGRGRGGDGGEAEVVGVLVPGPGMKVSCSAAVRRGAEVGGGGASTAMMWKVTAR